MIGMGPCRTVEKRKFDSPELLLSVRPAGRSDQCIDDGKIRPAG